MKYIFIIILTFLYQPTSAQELTSGLIMPDRTFDVCCIHLPLSGLKVYQIPNGKAIGKLVLGNGDGNGESYSAIMQLENETIDFEDPNLYMVGYEIMSIVFTDLKGDFVQTGNGYWLSVKEIKSKGLLLKTWMEYLLEKEDVLGWYANDPGLNLRKEASTNSEILATLKGDLWEIKTTNETDGLWCKVIVNEYNFHPCSGEESFIVRTLTGWIKILNDDQTPNVWNYGKGC